MAEGVAGQVYVEYMPLSKIKRAPRNAKEHDIGGLDGAMNQFGYVAPMILNDTTERLVAGHGRLDTLRQRKVAGLPAPRRITEKDGEWYVPVVRGISFDTDEQAEAYLLADNRHVELGGWDDSVLAEALSDLAAADELHGVGWDASEVDSLINSMQEVGGLVATQASKVDPARKYEEQYTKTNIRQIQLIMDQEEYEFALAVLARIMGAEDVDTNTDAVMLLLRRWEESS